MFFLLILAGMVLGKAFQFMMSEGLVQVLSVPSVVCVWRDRV